MFHLLVGKTKDEGSATVGNHGLVMVPVHIVVGLFRSGLTASDQKRFLNSFTVRTFLGEVKDKNTKITENIDQTVVLTNQS